MRGRGAATPRSPTRPARRRGTGRSNGTVHVEALHEAGADDDAVFSVAAALGLERRPVTTFERFGVGKQ